MDNLSFVKRFIAGTKEKCVQWDEAKGIPAIPEGFYTIRDGRMVAIVRFVGESYAMVIFNKNGEETYRIDEDNLLYDADGDTIVGLTKDDRNALSRLFRLAERSARRIDSLLDELAKDLPDDDDDLPF